MAGTLPTGVVRVDSPTNTAWLIGRTYTAGRKDFAAVHKVQDQYALAPLSQFGKAVAAPSLEVALQAEMDIETSAPDQVAALGPAEYFGRLAQLMKANPPAPADAPMVETLASLGIEPGKRFDFEALSNAERRGLEDASGSSGACSMCVFRVRRGSWTWVRWRVPFQGRHPVDGHGQDEVQNQWRIPLNIGVYGTDYPLRALVTCWGTAQTSRPMHLSEHGHRCRRTKARR